MTDEELEDVRELVRLAMLAAVQLESTGTEVNIELAKNIRQVNESIVDRMRWGFSG